MTHKLKTFFSFSREEIEQEVNTFTEKLEYETEGITYSVLNNPMRVNPIVHYVGVIYNDDKPKKSK